MSSFANTSVQSNTPDYALFDANAVAAATLFGTPVAGASLMALNYRRLGEGAKAFLTLFIGIAITGLVMLVGWNLPRTVTGPIGLALLFGTRKLAEVMQGPAVKDQVRRGGRLGSKWKALGLGCAILAALVSVVYLAEGAPGFGDSKVMIGSKDEIFYSGTATKEEALRLGNRLKEMGYLTDRGVSLFLSKDAGGKTLSFVVKEGLWNQPDVLSNFEEVGRQAARSIGGLPVKVRLINSSREVKAESTIGKAAFQGEDTVYYLGGAKESEAQGCGQRSEIGRLF